MIPIGIDGEAEVTLALLVRDWIYQSRLGHEWYVIETPPHFTIQNRHPQHKEFAIIDSTISQNRNIILTDKDLKDNSFFDKLQLILENS